MSAEQTAQQPQSLKTAPLDEMPEFIDDGWNADATIDPVPNLHRGMKFKYRPLGFFKRRQESREYEKITDEDARDMKRAEQMKTRLISWSYNAPITIENILNLPPVVFVRLEAIMNGMQPGDSVVIERKN